MGRLIDIENIDYVRLEDSLHCLEHHKGDEVECVICAPTVEAIPKDQYEARLKADMYDKDTVLWMFRELQLEIEESENCGKAFHLGLQMASNIIQQKINALKAESEDKK